MKISTINAVVMLNVANLTLPERNAKLHTDEQVEHIMNSIKEFGMNDPIGVWGNKNIIVEGGGELTERDFTLFLGAAAAAGCSMRVCLLQTL